MSQQIDIFLTSLQTFWSEIAIFAPKLLAGVVLLALLYEFSTGGGISLVNTGKVLLFVGLFFILAAPAAKIISVVIKRLGPVSEVAGLVSTTIVSLVLFFAWPVRWIIGTAA